jgi:hypothetical protein
LALQIPQTKGNKFSAFFVVQIYTSLRISGTKAQGFGFATLQVKSKLSSTAVKLTSTTESKTVMPVILYC